MVKCSFSILKRIAPYFLQTQVLIIVDVVMLHNNISEEVRGIDY